MIIRFDIDLKNSKTEQSFNLRVIFMAFLVIIHFSIFHVLHYMKLAIKLHWLSNQGALEEERRKEEVFVGRTASRLSRRESLEAVRKRLESEKEKRSKND